MTMATYSDFAIETHAPKSVKGRFPAIYRVIDRAGNIVFNNPDILKDFSTPEEVEKYGRRVAQEWIDAL